MEQPEDDEEADHAQPAAEEEPEGAGAVVGIAGREAATSTTVLDVSEWKLTAAQVREVAGALPKLLCLRELLLDGVPVSGSTPRWGDFSNGVESLDADLDMLRALCEGLRALPTLTSLRLKKCYLGPGALALVADLIRAMAALKKVALRGNPLTGGEPEYLGNDKFAQTDGKDTSGVSVLFPSMTQVTELDVSDCGLGPTSMPELAKLVSDARAALARVSVLSNPIGADGADALIEAFNQNSNLRTLLGIEEGVTELNLCNKEVAPGQAKILAAELQASRAVAALTSLAVGSNPIGDEAMVQLLDGLKDVSLASLDISKTKSGVSTASKLAELLSEETAFKAVLGAGPLTPTPPPPSAARAATRTTSTYARRWRGATEGARRAAPRPSPPPPSRRGRPVRWRAQVDQ
eukprot:COSAG01_NODE_3183_length_6447_cov_3.930687_1_plen_407_part_00